MARKPNPLDLPQRRTALHYGALRNALGNYGRLREDVILLTPAPKLKRTMTGWTLTISGLPEDAKSVILFDRKGKELDRRGTSGKTTLDVPVPRGGVAWVEVYRGKKTPIRLGIPIS